MDDSSFSSIPPAAINKSMFSYKVNIVSGILASSITSSISIPMDLIKIRMQQHPAAISAAAMARSMYRQDGVAGFYRGSLFGFVFIGVVSAAKFCTYKYLQYMAEHHETLSSYPARIAISSVVVSLITSVSMNPIELVRIKTLTPEFTRDKKGSFRVAQHLVRSYGILGLQKAYGYTLAREVIFHLSFFHLYESINDYFGSINKSGLGLFIASMVSSPISWILIYPIDTIKTNLQAEQNNKCIRMTGTRFIRNLHEQGNLSSLYRGLPSVMVRSAIINPVFLASWEKLMICLEQIENGHSA